MKTKRNIPLFITANLMISLAVSVSADVTLRIESATFLPNLTENTLNVSMNNPYEVVSAIQVDISFDTCSLDLSATEFDIGDVEIDRTAMVTLTVTNVGQGAGHIMLTTDGCTWAEPDTFTVNPFFSQRVFISCRPQKEGQCQGTVTLSGCGNDTSVSVTCNGVIEGNATLDIDKHTVLQNTKNNKIYLDLQNSSEVCHLQTDILFDSACFKVTSIEKTDRTRDYSLFLYDEIDGGIRIVLTGLGHCIRIGSGPVVQMLVDVSECHEGYYLWDITNQILNDPLAEEVPTLCEDGTIAILSGPKGDINSDSVVNAIDVVLAARIANGDLPDPSETQRLAADCNIDGQIDITDVIGIVNVILGMGTCPP